MHKLLICLPNMLSAIRLLLAPVIIAVAAIIGSKACFLGLISAALVTDILDGFLARLLNIQSEFGRKLDSWADYATVVAGTAGLWLLWPDIMRREWLWFIGSFFGIFAIVIYGILRYGKVLGYHTWLAKAVAWALPISLAALLAGWPAVYFHVVVMLQVICTLEELAIALLLPGHSGEVPTFWHAWKRRPLR